MLFRSTRNKFDLGRFVRDPNKLNFLLVYTTKLSDQLQAMGKGLEVRPLRVLVRILIEYMKDIFNHSSLAHADASLRKVFEEVVA